MKIHIMDKSEAAIKQSLGIWMGLCIRVTAAMFYKFDLNGVVMN